MEKQTTPAKYSAAWMSNPNAEELREEVFQFDKLYVEKLYPDILKQIEWTRLQHSIGIVDMEQIFENRGRYKQKIINPVLDNTPYNCRNDIKLRGFMRFCYLFGFDFSTFNDRAAVNANYNDDVLALAHLLSGASPEVLEALKDTWCSFPGQLTNSPKVFDDAIAHAKNEHRTGSSTKNTSDSVDAEIARNRKADTD